jgi:hypothetical protein
MSDKYVEHCGERLSVTDWADRIGVLPDTLLHRLRVMPLARALTSGSLAKPRVCGTRHSYDMGCRCADCRAAAAEYKRLQRARARGRA